MVAPEPKRSVEPSVYYVWTGHFFVSAFFVRDLPFIIFEESSCSVLVAHQGRLSRSLLSCTIFGESCCTLLITDQGRLSRSVPVFIYNHQVAIMYYLWRTLLHFADHRSRETFQKFASIYISSSSSYHVLSLEEVAALC